MASYTTSLRLVQPATGEYSGTWGTQVNNGLTALVDTSVAGTATITMTAADYTLSTANGATDEARAAILNVTGTPGAARNIIVPALSKLYVVYNNTTGGYAQTVKTSAGTGISVPNGATAYLRCDGTNVVAAVNYLGSLTLGAALPVASGGTGATTLTGVLKGNGTSAFTAGNVNLTSEVTGTLPVANGGTGATSLTTNNVILGNGTSAVQFVAPGTAGNVLTSNGTTWTSAASVTSTTDFALSLLGNTRNQFFSATGTFTVPAGITSIRAYAFGAGGAGANGVASTSAGGGGGGGGCAYGDITVTAGQTVSVTISGSSTTVAIGATTYLTANAGNAASGGTGGTGGTASKDASVTNGGAYAGGSGGSSAGGDRVGGGGGSSGSPVGIGGAGGNGVSHSGIGNNTSGGAGGGWGGSGGIGQAYKYSGGGGPGGAGAQNAGGGAGGAASNGVPGVGRGLNNLFNDPLLRPLNGFGGNAGVNLGAISPPQLGGGGVGMEGSFGGGAGGSTSGGKSSIFGGGASGGGASGSFADNGGVNNYGGGGGGGAQYSTSVGTGGAGGAGAVFILW